MSPLATASRAIDAYFARRYRVLFATLLVTLAVYPLSDALALDWRVLGAVFALNLVAAAAGIPARRSFRYALVAVAAIAALLRLISEEALPPWLVEADGIVWLAIALAATVGAVRFAMQARGISSEHVAAALSAYLLAGMLFAVLYVLVDYRWPGSVVSLSGDSAGALTLDTAIYYSFVTLATLGYGDVVPRGVARGLAIVEAVGAQLYLTVTVAQLVGLYTARSRGDPQAPGSD